MLCLKKQIVKPKRPLCYIYTSEILNKTSPWPARVRQIQDSRDNAVLVQSRAQALPGRSFLTLQNYLHVGTCK